MDDQCVSISAEEYEFLLDEKRFLDCLRAAGVDNWDWYDTACCMYGEEDDDDTD